MITDNFDNKSNAKINPSIRENKAKCDVCIITFSNIIEEYVFNKFNCEKIVEIKCVTGVIPIYILKYKNKKRSKGLNPCYFFGEPKLSKSEPYLFRKWNGNIFLLFVM